MDSSSWLLIGLAIYLVLLVLACLFIAGAHRDDDELRSAVGFCKLCGSNFYVPHAQHYLEHEQRAKNRRAAAGGMS